MRGRLLAVVVAAACGTPAAPPVAPLPPEPPPPVDAAPVPPEPPPEVPGPMSFSLAMPDVQVALVDAGKPVRRVKPIAHRFILIPQERVRVRTTLDVTYGDSRGDVVSPTVQLELDVEVVGADPVAGASIRAVVRAADLIDPSGAMLTEEDRREIARAVGATLSWTVEPQGRWSAVQVDVPAGISVTQMLFESIRPALGPGVVWPTEPLHAGATWDVTRVDSLAGLDLQTTTRFSLSATGAVSGTSTVLPAPRPAGAPPSPVAQLGGTGRAGYAPPVSAPFPIGSNELAAAMTLVVVGEGGVSGEPATLRLRRASEALLP